MEQKIERRPNWHHTLYYKRDYERSQLTQNWRRHPAMVVPLPYYDHENLHKAVAPVNHLPTEQLTRLALYHCAALQAQSDSLTHLEAFTSVRDELQQYHRSHRVSDLGKEALKFSSQFSRQLEFMSEVPILGSDWTYNWVKAIEARRRLQFEGEEYRDDA